MENKPIFDVHSTKSQLPGIAGKLESFLRTFRSLAFFAMLAPIAFFYVLCMGVSLTPGIMLVHSSYEWTAQSILPIKALALGLSGAAAFFMYGLTLIFVVPLCNKLLPLKVKAQRTSWFSLSVIPWYYHNALTYLVRYTFLDFITPTPFNKLFYQMMGMKIGKGSMINSSNISDPCLIEIGDYVTIGGSATLVAHYGMKGILIIDKLVIKNNATIGLNACLFGDVSIGEGVTVKPGEVVLPKTHIPNKERKSAA
ncbi:MAG: hypothetical protein K2P81_03175 [Bacteriovoracaceae bacterium]|nr:hypothetical protein [Bacteriovoracaceae bacterium]